MDKKFRMKYLENSQFKTEVKDTGKAEGGTDKRGCGYYPAATGKQPGYGLIFKWVDRGDLGYRVTKVT